MDDRYSPEGLRHRIPSHPDLFFTSSRFGYEVYRTVGPDLGDIEYLDGFKTKRELNTWVAGLPTVTTLLAAAELKRGGVIKSAEAWYKAQMDWQKDRTEADDRHMHAIAEHLTAQAALNAERGRQ